MPLYHSPSPAAPFSFRVGFRLFSSFYAVSPPTHGLIEVGTRTARRRCDTRVHVSSYPPTYRDCPSCGVSSLSRSAVRLCLRHPRLVSFSYPHDWQHYVWLPSSFRYITIEAAPNTATSVLSIVYYVLPTHPLRVQRVLLEECPTLTPCISPRHIFVSPNANNVLLKQA